MTQAFFHDGSRQLQDAFHSRQLADRLETVTLRREFTVEDKAFIEGVEFFFLATADAEGHPDCSFKGGTPGFVRVTEENELVFPDYDGNGMFRSLGNILVNPSVGLLFIALGQSPQRLRVNGEASVSRDDVTIDDFTGAQMLVRVRAEAIFPNCPRYIPGLNNSPSPYVPRPGSAPLEPEWKEWEALKDVVPPRAPASH